MRVGAPMFRPSQGFTRSLAPPAMLAGAMAARQKCYHRTRAERDMHRLKVGKFNN
jgi:hypothetical protein